MAVSEFIVLAGMQSRAASPTKDPQKSKKGSGSTAKAEVLNSIQRCQYFRVNAESTEEAINIVRYTYPGAVNDKCFGVKQSSGEEL